MSDTNKNVNLEFTEDGLDELAGGIGDLAASMEALDSASKSYVKTSRQITNSVNAQARAFERLATAAERAKHAMGGGGGTSVSSIGTAGRSLSSGRSAGGPMQNLHAAQRHFDAMAQGGSVAQQFDAQIRLHKANASFKKAQSLVAGGASTVAAAAGDAGEIAAVAATNPMVAVVAVVVAALTAAAGAAYLAADRITTFSKTLYETGGTARETAIGMKYGAAGGFDFGGAASQLGSTLNGGGPAAFWARRFGVNPVGNALGMGDQDFAGKEIKILRQLLDPTKTSDRTAIVAARALGQADKLWMRDASPEMRDRFMNNQARAYSPAERTNAADSQIALNLALDDFKRVATEVGKVFLPLATSALVTFSVVLETVFEKIGLINGKDAVNWKRANADAQGVVDKASKARELASRDRHADAMDRHSQALTGTYGGGSRTRGSVPLGWGYQHFEDATRGHAITLGGLTL